MTQTQTQPTTVQPTTVQPTTVQPPAGFCPYVPPVAGTPDEQAAWETSYRVWAWEQDLAARKARDAQAEALRLNPVPPTHCPDDSRTVEQVLIDLVGQETWDLIAPRA